MVFVHFDIKNNKIVSVYNASLNQIITNYGSVDNLFSEIKTKNENNDYTIKYFEDALLEDIVSYFKAKEPPHLSRELETIKDTLSDIERLASALKAKIGDSTHNIFKEIKSQQ